MRTLAEIERMSITEALRRTNGVIGGNMGAAAHLGLPRTTLIARMRKHGITKEPLKDAIPFPGGCSPEKTMGATA
jgi:formate hydrogenlyase transcriptional activator